MTIFSKIKAILATWNSPSKTPFTHQITDQLLHIAYGSLAGFVAYNPYLGIGLAAVYGTIREGEQWGTLNTPSIKDSLIDWTFVVIGGCLGAIINHYLF